MMLTVPAHAADSIETYDVTAAVASDGSLAVNTKVVPTGSPAQFEQRFALTEHVGRDHQYRFALSDWTASVAGTRVSPQVRTEGSSVVVTVPLKDGGPVEFAYVVRGAALDNGDGTTSVDWKFLQGLKQPVKQFDATVSVPGQFTAIDCYAGSVSAPSTCRFYGGGTHENLIPVFHDEQRASGEVVGAVLRFPVAVVASNQVVERLWSLDHAFSFDLMSLGLALLLLVGGLATSWLVHRRFGRDATAFEPIVIGSFKPVGASQSQFVLNDEIRPGHIGTLMDERVDPIDVTATILDLAVRNHLVLEQLPRETEFTPTDWTLTRVESGAALAPFERAILDAVAPASGESRNLAQAAEALSEALDEVQSEMYGEVVKRGWFVASPYAIRIKWQRIGWVSLAFSVVLAGLAIAFTTFGLAGLVLIGLSAAVTLWGQQMPARTAKGTGTLAGLGVLSGALLTQPTDELPPGREHQEVARILPYTVVLGGTDRWLEALAAVNDPDVDDRFELSWYRGPEGWTLENLPDSLRNFLRALQGTLVMRG